MSEPYIDASLLLEVEESKLHERNVAAVATVDWALVTTISVRYFFYGFPPLHYAHGTPENGFAPTDPTAPCDRYLYQRERTTWLQPNGLITPGGEYWEKVTLVDRITGALTSPPDVYFPDQETYRLAEDRTDFREQTQEIVTPEYRKFVLSHPFSGPLVMGETWLESIHSFEAAAARCASLLAAPNIDRYPIGSTIHVYENGNFAFSIIEAGGGFPTAIISGEFDATSPIGEAIIVVDHLSTYLGEDVGVPYILGEGGLVISAEFTAAGQLPGGASYQYIQSIGEIDMSRSKTMATGPVCIYTQRIQHPHQFLETQITTITECFPYAESESGILTFYLNPPCQRGADFWFKQGLQRVNDVGITECELPSHSGAPPDCSAS